MNSGRYFSALFLIFSLLLPSLYGEGSDQMEIPLSLFINNIYKGEILTVIDLESGEILSLKGETLSGFLSSVVVPSEYEPIKEQDSITPTFLKSRAIDIYFDSNYLTLSIQVPPEIQQAQELSVVKNYPDYPSEKVIDPENFAAYLNLFGRSYLSQTLNDSSDGTQNHFVTVEPSVAYKNLILQGEWTYEHEEELESPEVSLTAIWDSQKLWFTGGHSSIDVQGFQKGGVIQGVAMDYVRDHRSSSGVKSQGSVDFIIESPSRAEVWINGRKRESLTLSPGRYNLRDFPFYSGINDVELRIIPDDGPSRTINFNLFQDTELIPSGDFEYSLSAGGTPWTYETQTLTGYYRRNIFTQWNAGVNGQYLGDESLLGADLLWASPVGLFKWDGGVSFFEGAYQSFASRLAYRYRHNGNLYLPQVGLGGNYYDEDFLSGGESEASNWDLWININQLLFSKTSLQGGLSYGDSLDEGYDDLSLNLSLVQPLSTWGRVSLLYNGSLWGSAREGFEVSLVFQFSNRDKNWSVSTQQTLSEPVSQVDWQSYYPSTNLGASSGFSQDMSGSQPVSSLYAGISHGNSRYNGSTRVSMRADEDQQVIEASVNLASALAYTGGILAVSSPIYDSFAIIKPVEGLAGRRLGANSNGVTYEGESDILGPPVLNQIRSYRNKTVQVETLNLQENDLFLLPQSLFVLYPHYHSGTIIEVGSKAPIIMTVQLLDESGEPIELVTGKIGLEGESGSWFFTDELGQALLYDLHEGEYVMQLRGYNPINLSVTDRSGDEPVTIIMNK